MRVAKPFAGGLASGTVRISLCDTNEEMVDAWIDTFRDVDAVEIVQGDLLDLKCQALVSPCNSFGDMSGGLDKRIDDFFEGAAQRSVVAAIREQWLGELPVGAALLVPLHRDSIRFLVVAPTMRVPGNVAGTINAYLSMRATLVAILQHNGRGAVIERLGMPGLCTGVGGMNCGLAARQMRAAYDNVVGGGWREVVHPAMAPFALGLTSGKRWSFSDPTRSSG
jgi:O-acetyl-ADP-ribose deacetylase (regulator of RNase III)